MRQQLVRPTFIYLQNKETDDIDDSWTPADKDQITWSKDEVNRNDTIYVRADMIPEKILKRLGLTKERVLL